MYPEAILFDMDDTILVEDAASRQAWKETARRFAASTRLCDGDELYTRIRRASEWFWSDPGRRKGAVSSFFNARLTYVKMALHGLGCDDKELTREIVLAFTEAKDRLIGFLPGAEETVKTLSRRGMKLALLTNGDGAVQRQRVQRFGLDKLFPVCLIEGEIGLGKPDPRMFRMALGRLDTTAEKAWMVGDLLETDIAGARDAGIHSIWCDYGKSGLPADPPAVPDRTIHDISELLGMVEDKAEVRGQRSKPQVKAQSSRTA
jgi:putative hydrolase of the HAD superfamily